MSYLVSLVDNYLFYLPALQQINAQCHLNLSLERQQIENQYFGFYDFFRLKP
jgi:hypothetical protein